MKTFIHDAKQALSKLTIDTVNSSYRSKEIEIVFLHAHDAPLVSIRVCPIVELYKGEYVVQAFYSLSVNDKSFHAGTEYNSVKELAEFHALLRLRLDEANANQRHANSHYMQDLIK